MFYYFGVCSYSKSKSSYNILIYFQSVFRYKFMKTNNIIGLGLLLFKNNSQF